MTVFSLSDVGQKRTINQDFIYTSITSIGLLPNLFLVADGMGGHKAGDFASRKTVEIMVEEIEGNSKESPVVVLREAIEKANDAIYRLASQDEDMEGMDDSGRSFFNRRSSAGSKCWRQQTLRHRGGNNADNGGSFSGGGDGSGWNNR